MALEKRTKNPDNKPNKWRIRVTRNGHRYETMFFGNKKEALQAEKDFIYQIDKGLVGSNENMLFKDLFKLVMNEYVLLKCRNNTHRVYNNAYTNHLGPIFGDLPINKIKPIDIQKFINTMTKSYSPLTIKSTASVLNNTLKFAEKWEIISHSPYRHIKLPKEHPIKYTELMNMEEINKLISIYENETNLLQKAAFYLASGCGLRNSEIRALTLEDIDFNTNTITVDKQVGLYDTEKRTSIPTKTESSIRKIYMPVVVSEVLKEYINSMKSIPITKQLFYSYKLNGPIDSHDLSRYFRKILIANNLPIIRFHDLRHLHATLLINEGVNIKSVSSRLGHSKVETTLKFYTHSIEEYDKKAAAQLDSIFTQQKKGSTETAL